MIVSIGMLNVNSDKANKLAASLVKKGYRYAFPADAPVEGCAMVQHIFAKRDELGNIVDMKKLNERRNGFHNITNI